MLERHRQLFDFQNQSFPRMEDFLRVEILFYATGLPPRRESTSRPGCVLTLERTTLYAQPRQAIAYGRRNVRFGHGRRSLMRQVKINDIFLSSLPPPPPMPLPETAGTIGTALRPARFSSFSRFNSQQALSKFSPLWVIYKSRQNFRQDTYINFMSFCMHMYRNSIWTIHKTITRAHVLYVLILEDGRSERCVSKASTIIHRSEKSRQKHIHRLSDAFRDGDPHSLADFDKYKGTAIVF